MKLWADLGGTDVFVVGSAAGRASLSDLLFHFQVYKACLLGVSCTMRTSDRGRRENTHDDDDDGADEAGS